MLRIYSADLKGISLQTDISHGITDKDVLDAYNRDKKWILDRSSWKYGEKLVKMRSIKYGFAIDTNLYKPTNTVFYCKHGLLLTPILSIRVKIDYDWKIDKIIGDFVNFVG